MKKLVLTSTLFVMLAGPSQIALAQSPEMPVPILLLLDADDKPIAQIVDVDIRSQGSVEVAISFGQDFEFFLVKLKEGTFNLGADIYFEGSGCSGNAFLTKVEDHHTAFLLEMMYSIMGPDPTDGTYRVFRTTSAGITGNDRQPVTFVSVWDNSEAVCETRSGSGVFFPAEEVTPNPFEGFHGPTTTNPERVLKIKGGTKLP